MRLVKTGKGAYLCYSLSQSDVAYAVDVSHYGGLGSCTCTDFVARRKPQWREAGRKPFNFFRCKHIIRVRNHILDQIIQYYAKPPKKETD